MAAFHVHGGCLKACPLRWAGWGGFGGGFFALGVCWVCVSECGWNGGGGGGGGMGGGTGTSNFRGGGGGGGSGVVCASDRVGVSVCVAWVEVWDNDICDAAAAFLSDLRILILLFTFTLTLLCFFLRCSAAMACLHTHTHQFRSANLEPDFLQQLCLVLAIR